MTDWVSISSLATAGGTLVLAVATVASVRSANRAARAAELSLLAGLRPLLIPSRPQDPEQKVLFADDKWFVLPGGGGAAEVSPEAVYLALSLRNVGSGIAVLHGWRFTPMRLLGVDTHPPLEEFRRLSRDLYIPVSDEGFWQGAFRDPQTPEFTAAAEVVRTRQPFTVEIIYGDFEGGQRMVSRFSFTPRADSGWIAAVSRHWNIDRPDPR